MTDTVAPLAPEVPLPVGAIGTRASGWWGAWFLVISEASIFAYLLFSYFYFSVQPSAGWPPQLPSFTYAGPQTVVILIGCVSATLANRAIDRDSLAATLLWLGVTLLLCSGFIALQFLDWSDKPFAFASSTYSSEYFVITGAHLAHVVVGWVMFAMLLVWTLMGYFGPIRHVPISVGMLYWYFLAALWVAIFFALNVTPYFFR
jgi:heme/copper-type cytochrome/quinol oxidase subunit 3